MIPFWQSWLACRPLCFPFVLLRPEVHVGVCSVRCLFRLPFLRFVLSFKKFLLSATQWLAACTLPHIVPTTAPTQAVSPRWAHGPNGVGCVLREAQVKTRRI